MGTVEACLVNLIDTERKQFNNALRKDPSKTPETLARDMVAALTKDRDALMASIRKAAKEPATKPGEPEGALAAPGNKAEPAAQPSIGSNLERRIESAKTPGALRTLKNDLIIQRTVAADAKRGTDDFSKAIARIDELLATQKEAAPRVEGVLPPEHPQSLWAMVAKDEGRGYTELTEAGRAAWDSEINQGRRPDSQMVADYKRQYLPLDTKAGLAEVARLDAAYKKAEDPEKWGAILTRLDTLAENPNTQVAEAARKALGRDEAVDDAGRASLADWNTLGPRRNLDGSRVMPMAPGRVRMVVQNFLSKLAVKPNVTVVANQEALKQSNPALYKRAAAARSQGDFGTAAAAGYAFGKNEVIIFTDRIANEQHLRFVLAHETLGHFGMRGIMPSDKFSAMIDRIYETDLRAQYAADTAMDARKISKAEAVEEYLADYAAVIDVSTVARVWNAIKGFLERLGVKFADSAVRYLISQSRKYVRHGQEGVLFDPQQVGQRMYDIEYAQNGAGRYSPAAVLSESTKVRAAMESQGARPRTLEEAIKTIVDAGKDFRNTFDGIKAKYLSLTNFRNLENPGAWEVGKIIGQINEIAMSVKNTVNENLRGLYNASEATRVRISKVMYEGRLYKDTTFTAADMPKGALYKVNDAGDLVEDKALTEKLLNQGMLTLDEIREGFKYSREIEDEKGNITKVTRGVSGFKSFTDDEYRLYQDARRASAKVRLQLLQAEYNALLANRKLSYKEISKLIHKSDGNLSSKDRAFTDAFARKYVELYTARAEMSPSGTDIFNGDSVSQADNFAAKVNQAFIWRDTTGIKPSLIGEVREFFGDDTVAADKFVAKLVDSHSRRITLNGSNYDLQHTVRQLALNEINMDNKERSIKHDLATGYVPAYRNGNYFVQMQAFVGGKPVEVKDSHKALMVYAQFGKESEAIALAEQMSAEVKGKTFEVLVANGDGNFIPASVEMRFTTGTVINEMAADPNLNLQDFLYGLSLFNIQVNPRSMERIIRTLTRSSDSARNKMLSFSQTEGFDITAGVKALSQHIEEQASVIARASTRQQLRELMNLDLPQSKALWFGDEAGMLAAKARYDALRNDPNTSPEGRRHAQAAYEQALYRYNMTNPKGRANRMAVYYNEASSALSFLDGSKFVDESNFGAGPVASRVRAYTSMFQLGGSIAQGVMNMLSVYNNWIPYMAYQNHNTGFGGGFGAMKAFREYQIALTQVGAPGIYANMDMNQATFYDKIAQDKALQRKYGLSEQEARVIAREIRDGKLQPAQSNSLVATARGYTTNRWMLKFQDWFMSPFNLTEQATRRSAFLAAYRLHNARAMAAGLDAKEASAEAREKAVESLDLTLGEYSMMNRPPAWRGGFQSFLYMYKTYPTTTIQLLANLPRNGQIAMLFGLWLLSGAAGLPFAEDLEDLIDTLGQQLGFQQASVRATIIREVEANFPGMSPWLLKGMVNQFVPADIAARVSAGNFLPGTGIGLAGANIGREIQDILGPSAGFIAGSLGTARDLAAFPFSPTKSLEDVARNSPVTFARIMGDLSAYTQTGAVVDRRGYIVSPDVTPLQMFARFTGFYPERASTQYDIIRIANRETDYQKEVVAAYRQAWIKATMRGDTMETQNIVDAVNAWNQTARGTPFEIRQFIAGSQRALREAQRSAGERALKAAPKPAQETIQSYIDALTE